VSGSGDRVVRELDAVGRSCGVEHEDVVARVASGLELGELERAHRHGLPVVRPLRGRVGHAIALARELNAKVEADRFPPETLDQLAREIVGAGRLGLAGRDRGLAGFRQPAVADVALPALGVDPAEGVEAVVALT
jgi:hypothetical protein